MMKSLLFSLTILVLCAQVRAQSDFRPEWNIGVGFGPTFSTMSIMPTNERRALNTKSLFQFHGGVSARYITEKKLGIIGELNFSQQGWESQFDDGSTYKHTHKLNYLEIPLLTHIYFGSDKTRFFVNLGPKIAYLLSESNTRNQALESWLNEYDPDNEESFDLAAVSYEKSAEKKVDYGIMVGMGMEIRTGIGNFALEGRYYMGFGDIYNNRKKDEYSRSANRVLSARLTYFIKAFK